MFVFSIALYRFNVTYWSHVTQKEHRRFWNNNVILYINSM